MSKKTPEQLRDKKVVEAFDQINKAGQQLLTVFETAKYRTVITLDHEQNDKYPNLQQECISYFWNLTLSLNKQSQLVMYFTYDTEAAAKFGTKIFNTMIRNIMKYTAVEFTKINIEDCVRINTATTEVHNFFYKRFVDGENENTKFTALPYRQDVKE